MVRKRIKRWIQKHVGWDDPECDSTDWAHPAWFRGSLYSLHCATKLVEDVISGKNDGTSGMYEDADKLRQMVLGLKRKADSFVDERNNLVCERDSLRCDVERLTRELNETKWSD
jgi:hypothetical protein